jgi:beta-xylosidase
MHFQERKNIGRVCHLQLMSWKDDWPVIGVDMDMNGIGEPVYVWKKPDVGTLYPITGPQTSDEFNNQEFGFQWSWNHNPVRDAWSMKSNPGYLALIAQPAPEFLKAKNTLTQKIMGDEGEAVTCLLTAEMADGQRAGLCVMGQQYNLIGITKAGGILSLFTNIQGKVILEPVKASKIYLKVKVTVEQGANQFFFSLDNKTFRPVMESFIANNGFWKGPKIGLFSYNESGTGGKALFDWFHYLYDGPKQPPLPGSSFFPS